MIRHGRQFAGPNPATRVPLPAGIPNSADVVSRVLDLMAVGSKQISLFCLRKLIVLLATTAAQVGGY
jgi:hypothetical protein